MCGIFSYAGKENQSAQTVLKGLKNLEYRGYDSWGIAVKNGGKLLVKKSVGKISDAREEDFKGLFGSSAIGHTRWATHGGVSEKNTHPHFSRGNTVAVVHNGIIENYQTLKHELRKKYGRRLFRSETDSEVIPHLIADAMKRRLDFETASCATAKKLKGRFAFIALDAKSGALYAARDGSPLVVGNDTENWFVSSDIPALLDYTKKIYFLENGEYAFVPADGGPARFAEFHTGKKVAKTATAIRWTREGASKNGRAHFMLKEILDQKETLSATCAISGKELARAVRMARASSKIFMTACGTAGHMCMAAEYFFAKETRRPALFTVASEFHKLIPFVDTKTLLIAVTQSGETADLLEAIAAAKKRGAKILSLVNVRNSSVERESDFVLPINVGVEKAVASTKAASSQFALLALIACALGGKETAARRLFSLAAGDIGAWLSPALLKKIRVAARRFFQKEHLYVIGKSLYAPVALEAALKIKEVSYIHAEGLVAGELKHGTIALIEKGTPCMVLTAEDEFLGDVLNNSAELKARGAYIIGVSPKNHRVFDQWIAVPDVKDATPLAHMIVAQIFAYYLALFRGHNPDMPRNLAKSVTVK